MPETADDVLADLRRRGVRITPGRRAVVEALLSTDEHLNAEELAALVQRRHPDIHLSTVYRTLESLEAHGVLHHAHLGHGAAVYHVGEPHQHIVCEVCGAVTDVPAATLDDLAHTLRQRYGFMLHVGHFTLLGRCAHH